MFRNDYIDEVRQNLFTLKENKKKVIYLTKRYADIMKRIEEIDKIIGQLENAVYYGAQGKKVESSSSMLTKQRAEEILVEEAMTAIRKTEFDIPIYREGLIAAILSPKTILFSIGKEGTPNIKINLRETAGSTRDYAAAIRGARKALGIGKSRRVSKKRFEREGLSLASWFWKEKYYGPAHGKAIPQPIYKDEKTPTGRIRKKRNYNVERYKANYENTIATRASLFGNALAPWWQLLDRGNTSGWSGGKENTHDPYPTNGPTNFVQKALNRMKAEARKGIDPSGLDATNQSKALTELLKIRAELEKAGDYIQSILYNIEQTPLKQEDVIDVIARQLDVRLAKADRTKMMKLVEDIQLGASVQERIRIGGGVRIRTIEIQRILRSRGGR